MTDVVKPEHHGDGNELGEAALELCLRGIACDCVAFLAATLVIVGELLSEDNMWGVLFVGGTLVLINAMVTLTRLEAFKIQCMNSRRMSQELPSSSRMASVRKKNNRKRTMRAGESVAIPIASLLRDDGGLSDDEKELDESQRIELARREKDERRARKKKKKRENAKKNESHELQSSRSETKRLQRKKEKRRKKRSSGVHRKQASDATRT